MCASLKRWPLVLLLFSLLLSGCVPSRHPTIIIPDEEILIVEETAPVPVVSARIPQREKPTIIIDPGHGGEDFGTKSLHTPRYYEKNLNLTTALMLRNLLQERGHKVILTRDTDVFITLTGRAQMANAYNPSLFISVHYNSAPSEKAEGIEIFYYNNDKDKERSAQSKQLATKVLDRIIAQTKAKSRGVKHGNLAVVRETKMPAILIEGGFLTHDAEMQKLKDPAYLKSLAYGIVQGIENYLQ